MKRLITVLFYILTPILVLCAQETIVVGEIYDANTGEPISNVHIFLQGTKIGTITNAEGLFMLRTNIKRPHTMIVSAVGYHTERYKLEPHTQAGIEIALREKVGNLGEIFVSPQANPALPLMERVRARRAANYNPNTQQSSSSTSLYVSDIQSKHLQRILWKNLQAGMIKQDSTYLIPLYWRYENKDNDCSLYIDNPDTWEE